MTTNSVWDNEGTAETKAMYEEIIVQAIQIYGHDFYYIPRVNGNIDQIFGEDIGSSFDESYVIEMYVENTQGFEGQDLFQKFGVEIRDDATFVVAKSRWDTEVGVNEELIRPREGDLVYAPFSKALFEINEVVNEEPFYQLGHLPVYKLNVSLFRYNDENIDVDETGFLATSFSGTFELTMAAETLFEVGEDLTQLVGTATVTGEVVSVDGTTVIVSNVSNDTSTWVSFAPGPIEGVVSGLTATVTTVAAWDANYGENNQIEDEADFFTTFDPSNPFGDL